MTIFKETLDEEYITVSEAKDVLEAVEAERAADDERELRYELARAVEHVNRFAFLEGEESRALVEELADLEKVEPSVAIKIADVLPGDRTELRSVFANERYALDGEELDEILNVVAKYA
jgi:DNA-directed RNA polymerase subunit F